MRRNRVLWTGLTMFGWMALASCTPLRIQIPLVISDADWQTDGRKGNRDHVSTDTPLKLPLEQAWIYNAAGGFADGSPLVIENSIIVGTRKGEVHVVDLVLGEQIGTQEFSRAIEGTPALAGQVLFVPNAWGKTALEAFDLRSGRNKWQYEGVPIEASVLLVGDLVVVGDVEGNVMGIGQEEGLVRWLYEFGDFASILSAPAAVSDEQIVAADETGRIALLRIDNGEEIWRRQMDGPVENGLSAGSDLIFVPTTRGTFAALHASDGSLAWQYVLVDKEVRFSSAAVTKDRVIFGGSDGILRSLSLTDGSLQWTFHCDGTIAGAPVVTADLVFVGAMDKKIYGLRLDNGSIQWEATLRGRVKSAPAVRNGYLIVLSEPRYVYAFTNAENIQD